MRKREKSPGFSSNGSTMESMVGSRKGQTVDPRVESILDRPRITPNPGSGKKAFHLSPSGPGEERSGGLLIQDCQPSVMAVRSRQSGGDTAGSRNREVLANEETGKVPGLFVQRFDYGIDGWLQERPDG